jgi:acyl-CoA dehydrogenase
LRTTAHRDGDEWVLNGTKVFITNGGIADVTVVVASVDRELGHRGQASFVVPADAPGISQGKKESKLRIRASHTAEVVLEDCRILLDHLLGGLDKLERARNGQSAGTSSNALATFEVTRPFIGASAFGIAQAAYEWTTGYLEGRTEVAISCSSSSGCSRCWPTWPPRSRRRACSCGGRPGWLATACR